MSRWKASPRLLTRLKASPETAVGTTATLVSLAFMTWLCPMMSCAPNADHSYTMKPEEAAKLAEALAQEEQA